MFLCGFIISHKILVKLTYLILTLGMQSIVSNISRPKHRKIWNAHRHGSHRKVAWTLGWQDQLAYQRGAWVKWVGEVWSFSFWSETQCDYSIHVICVSHCFTCYIYLSCYLFLFIFISKARLRATRSQDDLPGQVDGEFISRSTVQSSLVFSCRTTLSTRRFNRGNNRIFWEFFGMSCR